MPADEAAAGDVAADNAAVAGGGEARPRAADECLCGQGRRTAVPDVLVHEAVAIGEERARVAGREAAQLP